MPPETAAQADRFQREEGQLPGTEARRKADDNRPSTLCPCKDSFSPMLIPVSIHPVVKHDLHYLASSHIRSRSTTLF
ncbi:uncharacterized protein B0T23DRAFT_360242 [Neurospora hispaniola]|uniref:Uncharacterized protein n=1 Tax=Neurospora hispaniola TaxID=588809 RepID=A0AAJ0MQG3_9PEZI|nr:hypothetical protein B0T23DRAFT_360242 [Neurospora hispaniola]